MTLAVDFPALRPDMWIGAGGDPSCGPESWLATSDKFLGPRAYRARPDCLNSGERPARFRPSSVRTTLMLQADPPFFFFGLSNQMIPLAPEIGPLCDLLLGALWGLHPATPLPGSPGILFFPLTSIPRPGAFVFIFYFDILRNEEP